MVLVVKYEYIYSHKLDACPGSKDELHKNISSISIQMLKMFYYFYSHDIKFSFKFIAITFINKGKIARFMTLSRKVTFM